MNGVRPHLIVYSLGVSKQMMSSWYEELHGVRPKRGPLPGQAANYLKDRKDARKLSIFLGIYRRITDSSRNSDETRIEDFVKSLEVFNKIRKETIDGNLAWFASREYLASILTLRYCSHCKSNYAYNLSSIYLRSCPFCQNSKAA